MRSPTSNGYIPTRQERRGRPHPFSSKARKERSTLEILRKKGWPRGPRIRR